MADDSTNTPVSPTRRERLFLARRRRRTRLAVSTALVVAVCGSAGAYAMTRRDDTTKQAARNGGGAPGPTYITNERAVPEVDVLKRVEPPRALTHDDPLRLWVGGDSLAGALGPALGHIAGASGVVHTQVDYKVSSGLSSNGVRDWQERAQQQMAQYDPEAVVFEIGTNDASIVNSHENADGVPEWEPIYRVQVAQMMDTLRGSADDPRTVIWVGAPTMALGWRDRGVQELNRVMKEEADKRSPDVVYVDAYKLFGDENGDYSSSLRTFTGDVERVRIGDGVHLTEAGANYLGAIVYSLLDARWDIEKHADTAQPINWDQSAGSGEVGSGSGSGRSGSGSSGSGSHRSYTPGTPAPPPSFETTVPPSTVSGSVTSLPPSSAPATTPASSTPPSSASPDSSPATTAPAG
jgi:hypothetical protein